MCQHFYFCKFKYFAINASFGTPVCETCETQVYHRHEIETKERVIICHNLLFRIIIQLINH